MCNGLDDDCDGEIDEGQLNKCGGCGLEPIEICGKVEEVPIEERKLTDAELKKREEVAKAIERDDPDMPMDKKMAIATATAKKTKNK